jgi:hypothetical protein
MALRGTGGGDSGSSATHNLPKPEDNPFKDIAIPPGETYDDALAADAKDAYGMQKARVQAAQPAFDALVAQAYGMTPTRYRGAAPANAPAAAQAPVSGAYQYRGPQFG